MTLKKCTVTQLDGVFWRVDVPGRSPMSMAVFRSEHKTTVLIDGAMKCGGLSCGEDEAIDRALGELGLTRHDEPETAEERVRAWMVGKDAHWLAQTDMLSVGDLRAILAELDRLRAREAKFALGPSVDAALAPIRGVAAQLRESAKWHESARLEGTDRGDRKVEAWHSARALSLEVAARRVEEAIAEAERVARDE